MIKARKSLGQHFLRDENIARKIVESFFERMNGHTVLEIGPGQGVLTKYILDEKQIDFYAVEFDERLVNILLEKFPSLKGKIFHEDFLQLDLKKVTEDSISLIGNFPYNISSQILFKMLEYKNQVPLMAGMFQKEVAKRVTASHNNKEYGILSVLLQSFYDCDYLFEVGAKCFSPPPKVASAVIRLIRKEEQPEVQNEKLFFKFVKAAFGKRRKTLRNGLKEFVADKNFLAEKIFDQRPEQLSVDEWIQLSNRIAKLKE